MTPSPALKTGAVVVGLQLFALLQGGRISGVSAEDGAERLECLSQDTGARRLAPGAVAVIGYHSDAFSLGAATKIFAFVLLDDVAQGTRVRFTDNGWDCARGKFRLNEGIVEWSATQNYSRGKVFAVAFEKGGELDQSQSDEQVELIDAGFNMVSQGDQLYAYQGTEDDPHFLYALSAEGESWAGSGVVIESNQAGCLPRCLELGSDLAFHKGIERDNMVYIGSRRGTRETLLSAIAKPGSWIVDNDPADIWEEHFSRANFTVLPPGTAEDDDDSGDVDIAPPTNQTGVCFVTSTHDDRVAQSEVDACKDFLASPPSPRSRRTLRWCLCLANEHPEITKVHFRIPASEFAPDADPLRAEALGGTQAQIKVQAFLPAIMRSGITLDGTSQPGKSSASSSQAAGGFVSITISGADLKRSLTKWPGLRVQRRESHPLIQDVTILGLAVLDFPGDGIWVSTREKRGAASCADREECVRNVRILGPMYVSDNRAGIILRSSSFATKIGAPGGTHVVIAGNDGHGIDSASDDLLVASALIGTEPDGLTAKGNTNKGISICCSAANSQIGHVNGTVVVSGNKQHGINSNGPRNRIVYCHVGVGIDGITKVPNEGYGVVFLNSAKDSIVGGGPSNRTIISANGLTGVYIKAQGTTVTSSFIGVAIDGNTSLGNSVDGVFFDYTAENGNIRASADGELPVISGNKKDGVRVNTANVKILDGYIGLSADGSLPLPNAHQGVYLLRFANRTQVGRLNSSGHRLFIGGNAGFGIVSEAQYVRVAKAVVGTAGPGVPGQPNELGGILLTFSSKASVLGSAGAHGAIGGTVISGNNGVGLTSNARDTKVLGCLIGTDLTGELSLPNARDGVVFSSVADRSAIGGAASPLNVISGNGGVGVRVNARFSEIDSVMVGVGASGGTMLPNRAGGVVFGATAYGSRLGSVQGLLPTVVAGNIGDGVVSAAEETKIAGVSIGVAPRSSSALPNQGHGVVLLATARNSKIGAGCAAESADSQAEHVRTSISGNKLGSVKSSAASTCVSCVSIGFRASSGDALPLLSNSSRGTGVEFAEGAAGSTVQRCTIVGHEHYGIISAAEETRIIDNRIGAVAAIDTTSRARLLGNGEGGLQLLATAGKAVVARNVVVHNRGSGVEVQSANAVVHNNTIGQGRQATGNLGYGVHLLPAATNATVYRNDINHNRFSSVRDDASGLGARAEDTATTNGWGLLACSRCSCYTDDATGTSVLCSPQGASKAVFNLGQDFPSALPANTTSLLIRNVALNAINWSGLAELRQLEALDLSENPGVVFDPPAGFAFPPLSMLTLRGVNLEQVQSNTLAGLSQTLEALDLSKPSVAPRSTDLNFTGFAHLSAMLYFSTECPAGFHATSAFSSDGVTVCARCPRGTTKLDRGGLEESCKPCLVGELDDDDDPTTSCIRPSPFTIERIARNTVEAVPNAEASARSDACSLSIVPIDDPDPEYIYTVGTLYRFTAVDRAASVIKNARGGADTVQFTIDNGPEGFLVDPRTGLVQGSLDTPGNWTMIFSGVDGAGVKAPAQTIRMTALSRDVDVVGYGPNGRKCEHGSPTDLVPFDGEFACDCSDTVYEGPNCDQASATATDGSSSGSNTTPVVIAVLLGALVVLLLVVAAVYKYRAQLNSRRAHDFEESLRKMLADGELDPEQAAQSRVPHEIRRRDLTQVEKIGQGAFGEVWKAILDESGVGGAPEYLVAAKTVIESDDAMEAQRELLAEATVMAQVPHHHNLVSLVGVITKGFPKVLVVSFCEHGSLLSVLRGDSSIPNRSLNVADKLQMAVGIACGMGHLVANGFVHRDLAARNILVASGVVCKVADFGLSRGVAASKSAATGGGGGAEYYRSQKGMFAVRWTAPEAAESLRFSTASDVWSFGVTMLELFDNGRQPYSALRNAEILQKTMSGYRAPQPSGCPQKVYELMLSCWAADPVERPSFAHISGRLDALVKNTQAGAEHATAAAASVLARSMSGSTADDILADPSYKHGVRAAVLDEAGYVAENGPLGSPLDEASFVDGRSAAGPSLDKEGYVADGARTNMPSLDANGYVAGEADQDLNRPVGAAAAQTEPSGHGGGIHRGDRKPSVYNGFGDVGGGDGALGESRL